MRRIVLTLAIATLAVAILEFLAYLFASGLSATSLANSELFQAVQNVRTILVGIQEYLSFTASVLALYDSILNNRKIWFITLLLSAVISFAATQVYDYPTLFFPRSPVTFFMGYLSLVGALVYGIAGMRGGRRIQAAVVTSTPRALSETSDHQDTIS